MIAELPASMSQGRLSFGSPAPAPAPTPAPAPEPAGDLTEKEIKAAMAAEGKFTHGRQKEIERKEGAIMNYVHNWENRTVVSASTIAKMKYSQRDMITENMRPIVRALNEKHDLKTVKTQFRGYFESCMEPVRCMEINGKNIESLLARVVGDMTPKELKSKVNDSTLGKLNKYLHMLRTFMTEEMDVTRSASAPSMPGWLSHVIPPWACVRTLLLPRLPVQWRRNCPRPHRVCWSEL